MYALIVNGKVADVVKEQFDVVPEWFFVECTDDCKPGWIYEDGKIISINEPEKTPDEIKKMYSDAISETLNLKAKEKQFDSDISICSYVTSSNPIWKAQAQAFIEWRDACWAYAISVYDDYTNNGTLPPPLDQFIADCPTLTWPA